MLRQRENPSPQTFTHHKLFKKIHSRTQLKGSFPINLANLFSIYKYQKSSQQINIFCDHQAINPHWLHPTQPYMINGTYHWSIEYITGCIGISKNKLCKFAFTKHSLSRKGPTAIQNTFLASKNFLGYIVLHPIHQKIFHYYTCPLKLSIRTSSSPINQLNNLFSILRKWK